MATASLPERPQSPTQGKNIKYEELSLGLLNINGLRNKIFEIQHIIARDKLHVVALCETKLNSNVKHSHVYIPGFSMWRKDRNDKSSNKGGGVALYVQDHIKIRLRPNLMTLGPASFGPVKAGADEEDPGADEEDPGADEEDPGADEEDPGADEEDPGADEEDPGADEEDPGAEIIWVEMELPDIPDRPVLLGCCYKPPKDKTNYLKHIKETISLVSKENKDIFLMGDFNIDWLLDSEKKEADEALKALGWTQIVEVPTRVTVDSKTCIDHIYTNISNPPQPKSIVTGCSDHNLITIKVNRQIPQRKGKFRSNKFEKETFQKDINDSKWKEVCKLTTHNKSLQEALNMFTTIFLQVVNKHTKLNTKNIYMLLKVVGLEKIFSERDRKKEKVIKPIFEFIESKKNAQVEMEKYRKNLKGEDENDAPETNRRKTRKGKKNTSQGASAKEGDQPKQTQQINTEITDLKSVFEGFQVPQKKKTNSEESIFKITNIKTVTKCLKYVCDDVVKVIDKTEAEFWKLAAHSISAPIRDILSGFIKMGKFPNELKKIKSFSFLPDSYINIRQRSAAERVHIILSYIFDVILYVQAKPFFIGDALNSAETRTEKLKQIKTDRLKLIKKPRKVRAILLDFTSSFETINRDLLITKLKKSDLSGSDLKLIESFLSIQKGSSGLSGGSCLTQLLQIIIINDLKIKLEPSAVIYNSYMMIYGNKLNKKMETVNKWAKQFNISFKDKLKLFQPSELSAMFKILESMTRCHGDESNWLRAPGNIVKQNGDWEYDNVSKQLEIHFGPDSLQRS